MRNMVIKNGAKFLKSMANEKRLEIVSLLLNQELKVGDLEKLVHLSQSALSQHLAILRKAKIVKAKRVAQSVFYSLCDENAKKLIDFFYACFAKPYK